MRSGYVVCEIWVCTVRSRMFSGGDLELCHVDQWRSRYVVGEIRMWVCTVGVWKCAMWVVEM